MTHFIEDEASCKRGPGVSGAGRVACATMAWRSTGAVCMLTAWLVLSASSMHARAGEETVKCWDAATYDPNFLSVVILDNDLTIAQPLQLLRVVPCRPTSLILLGIEQLGRPTDARM